MYKRGFVLGTCSQDYGGQGISQYAIYNWRTREAVVIQSESKGLETSKSNGVSPRVQRLGELECPKTGKDRCPSSRRKREFALPLHFCSIQALSGL